MAAIQGMPRQPRTAMDVESSKLLSASIRVRVAPNRGGNSNPLNAVLAGTRISGAVRIVGGSFTPLAPNNNV